jgi:AraC-like DNA-binding protein
MTKTNFPVHTLDEGPDDVPFKVLRLNKPSAGTIAEAHRHNYYEILLFLKGGGSHMIDFDQHKITGSSLHFVSPGQIHALQREATAEGYVVIFSSDFMLMNLRDISILHEFPAFTKTADPVLKMNGEDFAEALELIQKIESEFKKQNPHRDRIIASYIMILLLKSLALLTQTKEYKQNDASSQELLQRFNVLLEQRFTDLHKVNEYAELLNVTPNHLSETLKKISGKTAGDLIHQRLILEAKRMLLHSNISAKEVSYALNFNDPSYFSRFFKTNTGMSPEAFRKDIRERYRH